MEKVGLPINRAHNKLCAPIKTKIAAWIMTIIGVAIVLGYFILGVSGGGGLEYLSFILIPVGIFLGAFFYLPGISLLKRKKLAWYLAIILLFICLIINLTEMWYWVRDGGIKELFVGITAETAGIDDPGSIYVFLLIIIPLILLLLDRKNFWKIAT